MPAEGRGRAEQLARRETHGGTRGRPNRVHETRRARRTGEEGGPAHQRRPVRGRGTPAPGVPLPAQAGSGRRGWTTLRGLRRGPGPEPPGPACSPEERVLPGTGDSTSLHSEGERQAPA